MTVPQEAIDAAAGVIGKFFGHAPYEEDELWAADILKAAAPVIAAAERERCRRTAEREAAKCAGTIAGNALYDLAELLRAEP